MKLGELLRVRPTLPAPIVAPSAPRMLPSYVLVLSCDGRQWARGWGVRQVLFTVLQEPTQLGLVNAEEIVFGPYQRGWPVPVAFCVLDRVGRQVSPWAPFHRPIVGLKPGSTVTFAPGALVVQMIVDGHKEIEESS
jgi:hypothetical protein